MSSSSATNDDWVEEIGVSEDAAETPEGKSKMESTEEKGVRGVNGGVPCDGCLIWRIEPKSQGWFSGMRRLRLGTDSALLIFRGRRGGAVVGR